MNKAVCLHRYTALFVATEGAIDRQSDEYFFLFRYAYEFRKFQEQIRVSSDAYIEATRRWWNELHYQLNSWIIS